MTELIVKIGSAVVLLIAGMLGLSALYRWGPSRQEAEWKWITPGAGVAIAIAMIGSLAFSWYVANFGSYNETYGSLGAIIGFMTWLWIMMIFVITGGELNAEMEHHTRKDTTTGPEKELGTRGAEMADTVADGPDDVGDDSDTSARQKSSAAGKQDRTEAKSGSAASPSGEHAVSKSKDGHPLLATTRPGNREPLGLSGGLMLLGAVALTVAAANAGRKEGAPAKAGSVGKADNATDWTPDKAGPFTR